MEAANLLSSWIIHLEFYCASLNWRTQLRKFRLIRKMYCIGINGLLINFNRKEMKKALERLLSYGNVYGGVRRVDGVNHSAKINDI